MPRQKPTEEQKLREGEAKAGFREKSAVCRFCKRDLEAREQPEGICDKCLRDRATYVRTDAA